MVYIDWVPVEEYAEELGKRWRWEGGSPKRRPDKVGNKEFKELGEKKREEEKVKK